MSRRTLVVIDEFYEDPDSVRASALGLRFARFPGATYPGGEAIDGRDWSAVWARLREQSLCFWVSRSHYCSFYSVMRFSSVLSQSLRI